MNKWICICSFSVTWNLHRTQLLQKFHTLTSRFLHFLSVEVKSLMLRSSCRSSPALLFAKMWNHRSRPGIHMLGRKDQLVPSVLCSPHAYRDSRKGPGRGLSGVAHTSNPPSLRLTADTHALGGEHTCTVSSALPVCHLTQTHTLENTCLNTKSF